VPTRKSRSDRPVIREIEIEGFKSIDQLKLELGRVTVLIGENGCGKSNILEAIAFASAAYADRLDNEFLASRGIRSTEPKLMRPAFPKAAAPRMSVKIFAQGQVRVEFLFDEDVSSTVTSWSVDVALHDARAGAVHDLDLGIREAVEEIFRDAITLPSPEQRAFIEQFAKEGRLRPFVGGLGRFLVFSPENSALRTFQREGQILPIGINGEGLFAHLQALKKIGKTEILEDLSGRLKLIDWFSGFELPGDLGPGEQRLSIRDHYLPSDVLLDQRSANEGFLFLLFYYTVLLSPDTPTFFAIDNIDASLNPRLCAQLMSDVVELAKQQNKQVVVTTHNPAVLDGLDLIDDEQRLVVVSRTQRGSTRVRRIPAPEPVKGAPSLLLSEAFIRGFLGGLPSNF
jgi:energy-coupling factor transporter ATP-binding protein EcfA2